MYVNEVTHGLQNYGLQPHREMHQRCNQMNAMNSTGTTVQWRTDTCSFISERGGEGIPPSLFKTPTLSFPATLLSYFLAQPCLEAHSWPVAFQGKEGEGNDCQMICTCVKKAESSWMYELVTKKQMACSKYILLDKYVLSHCVTNSGQRKLWIWRHMCQNTYWPCCIGGWPCMCGGPCLPISVGPGGVEVGAGPWGPPVCCDCACGGGCGWCGGGIAGLPLWCGWWIALNWGALGGPAPPPCCWGKPALGTWKPTSGPATHDKDQL